MRRWRKRLRSPLPTSLELAIGIPTLAIRSSPQLWSGCQASLHKMFDPGLADYGYGWEITKSYFGPVITHNGASSVGTGCFVARYLPSGTTIIWFTNRDSDVFLSSRLPDRTAAPLFGMQA